MANKPIQSTDIASADVFTKLITDTKALMAALEQSDKNASELAKSLQKVSKGLSANNAGDLQKAINAEKLLTTEITEQGKRQVEKEKIEKRLNTLQKQKEAQTKREIKAAQDLKSVYVQQTKQLGVLNKALAELAARGRTNGKVYKGLIADQQKLRASLEGINSSLGRNQFAVGRYENALKGLRGSISTLMNQASKLGLVLGGGMIVRGAFRTLIDYDEGLANIAKTTKLTIEQARDLSNALLNIDTRTSISNLQELATAAGRLGIEGKNNIIGFVTAADKAFVALGDDLSGTADEIATTLGKISAIYGGESKFGVQGGIERTGSAINELAANSKAAAEPIIDFTNRLAGIASQANISQTDIMALGALFDASGQSIEVASTTLNKLLPALAANQEKYAKVAGLTAEEFGNMLQNNPIEALKTVAKGAASSEGGLEGLVSTLGDFGVESARAASIVGVLSSQTDELTKLQGIANDAYEKNTSLQDEFNTKNQTTAALLDKLKKEWDKQILGIGGTTKASQLFKSSLTFLINNLGTIISLITKAAVAYGVYKSVLLASRVQTELLAVAEQVRTKGLSSLITKQKDSNKATAAGAAEGKNYNSVLKNLTISGIIIFLGNLAAAWYDVASGAKNARLQAEAFRKAEELGSEKASKFVKTQSESMEQELRDIRKLGLSESELQKRREEIQSKYIKNSEDRLIQAEKEKKKIQANVAILNDVNKVFEKAGASLSAESYAALEKKGLKAQQDINKSLEELGLQSATIEDSWLATEGSFARFLRAGKAGIVEIDSEINGLNENVKTLTVGLDELVTSDLEIKDYSKEFENGKEALTGLALLQEKLNKLEKERSDLLVKNAGVIDGEYIKRSAEIRDLEQRIANFKTTLGYSGGKAEKRSGAIPTTQGRDGDINRQDVDLTKLKKNSEKKVALTEEEIQAQKDLAQNLTDVTIMLIDKRIEALDREAEAQKRNYDEAKQREQEIIELRKAGAVNTAESLAFEREAQAKALKEQEKIAKKKQRLELTNSAINMFNSAVQNGNGNPLGKTMADVSALVGFIRTLPAFWSGTDTTVGDALGTQFSSGRDGILARVDKSEMILNKGKVDKLAGYGITTTDGILEAIEGKRFVATSTSNRAIVLDNSEVVAKLDKQEKLLQQIASRPHESTDIEKISNAILITQQLTQGNKVTNSTKVIRTK